MKLYHWYQLLPDQHGSSKRLYQSFRAFLFLAGSLLEKAPCLVGKYFETETAAFNRGLLSEWYCRNQTASGIRHTDDGKAEAKRACRFGGCARFSRWRAIKDKSGLCLPAAVIGFFMHLFGYNAGRAAAKLPKSRAAASGAKAFRYESTFAAHAARPTQAA